MTIALFTNSVSPHQLPLARELAKREGAENYRYIYTDALTDERKKLGWGGADEPWVLPFSTDGARERLLGADVVLMQSPRDWDLFEERLAQGKACIYVSERWFKPSLGFLRMLHPKYFLMARRFVKKIMLSPHFMYLPDGIHAARDMARLCGFFNGDWRCLFRAPRLDFEKKPGGRVVLAAKNAKNIKKYCLDKMRIWGYFVAPSQYAANTLVPSPSAAGLRVLWVGRLLALKRVDTIIKAVGAVDGATLDIYGSGPEEVRLKSLAAKYGDKIRFHEPVSIDNVRKLMREHDVYVLSSNGYEGWGAVVGEALEEGMKVVGTYEAGSSVTILPDECLFHAGDVAKLVKILSNIASLPRFDASHWSVSAAASALREIVSSIRFQGI